MYWGLNTRRTASLHSTLLLLCLGSRHTILIVATWWGEVADHDLYTILYTYRTLRGRDQREKCTLNVVKYTFQVKCTLLTTKSALTVQ